MSDIYCGVGAVPKKSKLGSMKQCAEKKQIRYWGVKKIDTKMLALAQGKSKTAKDKKTREKVMVEVSAYRGKIRNLTKKLDGAKDAKEKSKLEKDLDDAKDGLEKKLKLFREIEAKLKKTQSRATSAKSVKSKKSKKSKKSRKSRN